MALCLPDDPSGGGQRAALCLAADAYMQSFRMYVIDGLQLMRGTTQPP